VVKLGHEGVVLRGEHVLLNLIRLGGTAQETAHFLTVLQLGFDKRQQVVGLERFRYVGICTGIQTFHLVLYSSFGCYQYHGDVA